MRWTMPTLDREQLVLFATKLDDIVGHDHAVRVVDRVLSQLDWTALEAKYNGRIGKPPIHPRVLCGILLHGLISGIRASRKLEEALHLRADFRWLAHGMSIDHTTLSEFRRKHPDELRDLFVQIVLVGKSMGVVQFRSLGFDGTHLRANNRKTGTRTPAELRQAKEDIHEDAIERQKAKMNREGSAEIYAGRRHPGERPFAVIKSSFGARQFLTRGLKNVQTEWRWLATAFNLHRLLGYIRSGVDPP